MVGKWLMNWNHLRVVKYEMDRYLWNWLFIIFVGIVEFSTTMLFQRHNTIPTSHWCSVLIFVFRFLRRKAFLSEQVRKTTVHFRLWLQRDYDACFIFVCWFFGLPAVFSFWVWARVLRLRVAEVITQQHMRKDYEQQQQIPAAIRKHPLTRIRNAGFDLQHLLSSGCWANDFPGPARK